MSTTTTPRDRITPPYIPHLGQVFTGQDKEPVHGKSYHVLSTGGELLKENLQPHIDHLIEVKTDDLYLPLAYRLDKASSGHIRVLSCAYPKKNLRMVNQQLSRSPRTALVWEVLEIKLSRITSIQRKD